MIKLDPLRDMLVLKRDKMEDWSSTLHTKDREQWRSNTAEVLEVGPEVTKVAPGDRVVYKVMTGIPFALEGGEYHLIPEDSVEASIDST